MTTNHLLVKMVFDRWNTLLKNCDNILQSITDEQLQKEIAPNKNRGIYILGHLIAVHDAMLPLLNLGEMEHPELYEIFVKSPDKSAETIPSVQELRVLWKNQLETLTPKLESIATEEWFEKHTSVAAEDFEKEPHRNKLNIILTRTTHLSYHVGQLILLK
ncbi:DinB family protein [Emticicia sp. SJ17W-69]|uniref:DinB family protein n=1 Tax=Emticicia sp. SJ17W-69 TaxID=3421657 RepID=UPI003EBDE365